MRLFRRAYSHLDEEKVIQNYLQSIITPNNFIVDVGAGNGIKMSNTYRLFKNGYPGVAIEADSAKCEDLRAHYKAFTEVEKLNAKVLPKNINALLKSVNTPKECLLLDLDIDCYDYFVLEAILQSFKPVMIITEINESIPPPIKFKVLPDENFEWKGGHFFGYSISCLDEIIKTFDYSMVELHYNNAVLISNEFWRGESLDLEDAYTQGYWQKPNRRRKFHYNKDFDYLIDLAPSEVIKELNNHFSDHHNRYQLNY